MNFLFFKLFSPFSHTILMNAPGTILDHSHNCAHVIFGENHTLMHGILCVPAASLLLKSKF